MLIIALFAGSCSPTRQLTTNSEEHQLREHFREITKIDSVMVFQRDSVYIRERADTVFVDRVRTLISYRDRLRVDTLRSVDTVRIITVEKETVEVNRLTGWQWFQVWCGRIFVLIAGLIVFYLVFKWKLKS